MLHNSIRFDSSRQQCVAQRQINILRSAFFSHPISAFARRTRRRNEKIETFFNRNRRKSPMGLALAATRVGKRPIQILIRMSGYLLVIDRLSPLSILRVFLSLRDPVRGTQNSKTKIGCVKTVCSVISAPDSIRTFNNSLFPLFYEQKKKKKNETKSFGYTTVKIEFISSMWHMSPV